MSSLSFRVLVVDDGMINREVLKRLLMKRLLIDPANIEEAEDGVQCLQKLAKSKFDIILMDLEMPRLNGVQAARIISGRHNNTLSPEEQQSSMISLEINDEPCPPLTKNSPSLSDSTILLDEPTTPDVRGSGNGFNDNYPDSDYGFPILEENYNIPIIAITSATSSSNIEGFDDSCLCTGKRLKDQGFGDTMPKLSLAGLDCELCQTLEKKCERAGMYAVFRKPIMNRESMTEFLRLMKNAMGFL